MGEPCVEIQNLEYGYGDKSVLRGTSFVLPRGEIACLLGASGSGKTTLLRLIAGFENLRAGSIVIRGKIVSRVGYSERPEQRRVGLVFQEHALFPHMTIQQNVLSGVARQGRREAEKISARWLEVVGLAGFEKKYPHELSGGEKQRVAVARALAPGPDLLLMDEPFSSLDPDLRERLRIDVKGILKGAGVTALIVTHDQDEAFSLADTIGVLNEGRIEQWGTCYDLYHRPANAYVAGFMGQGVFVSGKLISGGVQTGLGFLRRDERGSIEGTEVHVFLRPDDVTHDDDSPTQALVLQKDFRGASILYTLRAPNGETLLAQVPSHHDHAIGSPIGIRLEADHVICFPEI